MGTATADALAVRVGELLAVRLEANERFFAREAEPLARCCHRMAERFARGGRLVAFGRSPAARSDARHIAVEFVHPAIVRQPRSRASSSAARLSGSASASNATATSSGSSTAAACIASGPPSAASPSAGSARLPTITGCTNSTAM